MDETYRSSHSYAALPQSEDFGTVIINSTTFPGPTEPQDVQIGRAILALVAETNERIGDHYCFLGVVPSDLDYSYSVPKDLIDKVPSPDRGIWGIVDATNSQQWLSAHAMSLPAGPYEVAKTGIDFSVEHFRKIAGL